MTSLEGIPILGRGLDWTNGFNKHVLGTSSLLGPGDAEMKDGEVALHLCEVGQLEHRREGETGSGSCQVARCGEHPAAWEAAPCAWCTAGVWEAFVE